MSKLQLRLFLGDLTFGPGKAELLARIAQTGSIAAAGRQMGMSYKRAWMLVEEMNTSFSAPLVISARGGAGGGGAQLTREGQEAMALYARILGDASAAAAPAIAALEAMLRPDMALGDISGKK